MDAQRFDTLTKTLAARLSRRTALRRTGAAAAASALGALGLRVAPAHAQDANTAPVFTIIRRYSLSGPPRAVREALVRGYVEAACQAPGFIAYFTVEDMDGDFATVAVFRSEQDFVNFANAEATWIAQNLGDLLPAPEEAIGGATYVHVGNPQAFSATCPASAASVATTAPAPTNAPAAPTPAPAAPTAAPVTPTAQSQPACTGQGCACTTGIQAPCDAGLICCPTTDLMGGPGVCQTEAVCHPTACPANGDACPDTCSWGDACPGCCSGYCHTTGLCDQAPVLCSGEGCTCNWPNAPACDPGLVCCLVQGEVDQGYLCTPEASCPSAVPSCTGEGCVCDWRSPSPCDPGLFCCLPSSQGEFTCMTEVSCGGPLPTPPVCDGVGCCDGIGCFCDPGIPSTCAPGLTCCAVEGGFTCSADATCGASPAPAPAPACTGPGCDCAVHAPASCDDGLICCGPNEAEARGTCQTLADCTGPAPEPAPVCNDVGCPCVFGDPTGCAPGLFCCGVEGGAICGTDPDCGAGPAPACDGEGCFCDTQNPNACAPGLVCCLPNSQGDFVCVVAGTCDG